MLSSPTETREAPALRRREFITLLGGAAAGWPLAARAQQPVMPVIGYLGGLSRDTYAPRLAAFHKGLSETGYAEGRDLAVEYRWAEGQYDRLPTLAADLVRRQVSVIAALGGDAPAHAAKAATTSIPIVFAVTADPVKVGLVASLNRPGGNVTGVNFLLNMIPAKQFEVLHETVPKANVIGLLINQRGPEGESAIHDVVAAAQTLGHEVFVAKASSEPEIDGAFAELVQRRVGAILVGNDVFFYSRRDQIVDLAARYAIPAMYNVREFAQAGGLMSYGTSVDDAQRLAGVYVGRILRGGSISKSRRHSASLFRFRCSAALTRSSNETARVGHRCAPARAKALEKTMTRFALLLLVALLGETNRSTAQDRYCRFSTQTGH